MQASRQRRIAQRSLDSTERRVDSGSSVRTIGAAMMERKIERIVHNRNSAGRDLQRTRDVSARQQQVVSQIDTLTGSLNLDEETDESKCSTLTSSSSGATGSSGGATVHRLSRFSTTVSAFSSSSCSSSSSTVLTVLRRAKPPVPPPRTTPVSVSSLSSSSSSSSYRGEVVAGQAQHACLLVNGSLVRVQQQQHQRQQHLQQVQQVQMPGGSGQGVTVPNGDAAAASGASGTSEVARRLQKCSQVHRVSVTKEGEVQSSASKERVRFSDMVQYHGFVYDSDRSEHRVQQRMRVQETRSVAAAVQHRHQCPGGVVPLGGTAPSSVTLVSSSSSSVFYRASESVVRSRDDAKPPPKAILRKSRNTTV
ncbi:protein Largen isoform X1 [Petromyzon marinus]|uniref:protein Largen isoform X1 n=1 Tax=Petromyzon marinus TaxID=7757 RepID=UPI003F728E22